MPIERRTKVVGAVGSALLAGALLWWAIAVPRLVKYPTDLDVTPRYAGTFSLFVDPTTAAPLSTPVAIPLTIDRHIKTLGSESGASRVVVDETINLQAGTIVNTTQHNVYVMDRSTLENVSDPRAYAFDASNVVDRSGTYRINLPFDTSPAKEYAIYKNEIGTSYQMRGDTAQPSTTEAGLTLQRFTASLNEAPLSAAYIKELAKSVPLPASLSLTQLKPQLKQMGVDVDALLAVMAPQLTPQDLAALATIAASPIALQYVLSFEGTAAVEPTTGAEVDVAATETVGARPLMPDLPALQTILSHYPSVDAAKAASDALAKLPSAPALKVFSYEYRQTPASVVEIGNKVSSMRTRIRVATVFIPFGLAGLGIVGLVAASLMFFHRRRVQLDVRHEPPDLESIPEPHGASASPTQRSG